MSLAAVSRSDEARAAAGAAGLRYVGDGQPGIRRMPTRRGFNYVRPDNSTVRDEPTLRRIQALAIPPAWTDVWICPDGRGHVQATGRDARRRKQYRYHLRWREARDEAKFERTLGFAQALPKIRRRVADDLGRRGLPRAKVLATVVRLLELTLIRVGNAEYARTNGSYGLSTLRDGHARADGDRLAFRFRAKGGKRFEVRMRDRRLARIVAKCQDLPGQELFQYLDDDGRVQDVGSDDVNAYLREIGGDAYTAKDFRTWAGAVLAAMALRECEAASSKAAAKRVVRGAIEAVAERLGNTPSVCRKCYVHPEIVQAYLEGGLKEQMRRRVRQELAAAGLDEHERDVLRLLQRRLAPDRRSSDARRGTPMAA
jgi:DNA topoisomerase-1